MNNQLFHLQRIFHNLTTDYERYFHLWKYCVLFNVFVNKINFKNSKQHLRPYLEMAKRITIMLDDDNAKKLRILQAKKVKGSTSSISFSGVINEVIEKGLK